jgi:hypothetical protein
MELLVDLAPTGTTTPSNLQTAMPFVRVTRIGGSDTRIFDDPRVDIDAFAGTREAAYVLAEACRQRLINYPHRTSLGLIDLVTTDAGPHEVPWGDTTVRHFTSSYSLSARR